MFIRGLVVCPPQKVEHNMGSSVGRTFFYFFLGTRFN